MSSSRCSTVIRCPSGPVVMSQWISASARLRGPGLNSRARSATRPYCSASTMAHEWWATSRHTMQRHAEHLSSTSRRRAIGSPSPAGQASTRCRGAPPRPSAPPSYCRESSPDLGQYRRRLGRARSRPRTAPWPRSRRQRRSFAVTEGMPAPGSRREPRGLDYPELDAEVQASEQMSEEAEAFKSCPRCSSQQFVQRAPGMFICWLARPDQTAGRRFGVLAGIVHQHGPHRCAWPAAGSQGWLGGAGSHPRSGTSRGLPAGRAPRGLPAAVDERMAPAVPLALILLWQGPAPDWRAARAGGCAPARFRTSYAIYLVNR